MNNFRKFTPALGAVYRITTGKYSEAVAELKRALALAPNSDEAYRRLGVMHIWQVATVPKRLRRFQKAISNSIPYYWVNQDSLGRCVLSSPATTHKALESFHAITGARAKHRTVGFAECGNVYLQQGKYAGVRFPYLQKALQIEPNVCSLTRTWEQRISS